MKKIKKIIVDTRSVDIGGVAFTAFKTREEFQKLLDQVGDLVDAVNELTQEKENK